MAGIDFNKVKESVQKSAKNVKESMNEATEKLQNSVKSADVGESAKKFLQKSQSAIETIKTKSATAIAEQKEKNAQKKQQVTDALETNRSEETVISCRSALRIIYLLIVIDGVVSTGEKEKYHDIGKALDPEHFSDYESEVVAEGNQLLEEFSQEDEETYYDTIHDQAGEILLREKTSTEGIQGKALIWNLLTVAYSDGEYSKDEKRLIRYIAKALDTPYEIVLEMEHTLRTLLAIEGEKDWMKQTSRTYNAVEDRMQELAHRESVMMQAIETLIAE